MADEGLSPGVQDTQAANRGAQMPRVGGHLAQRGGTGVKEPGVQTTRIAVAPGQERVRQREDHVHVRDLEQIALLRREPPLTGLRLTLRTVSIAARVVGDGLMAAGPAPIEMAAECGGPAAGDRAQDRPLLDTQPRMLLDKVLTLRMEDISHLHRGPGHAPVGLRSRRGRASTRGGETCRCSNGCGAACR
jgi:hypothetical protein